MRSRTTFGGQGFGGGLTGPVPRDIWLLLGLILTTFSLQYFASTAIVPALMRLTPAVWRSGFLWQLFTYPFAGTGAVGIWLVIELLILLMFGREVFLQLGRRQFWLLLAWSCGLAAAVAVGVQLLGALVAGAETSPTTFSLMQGQRMLLAVLIAAFATMNRRATILLFFVLPIQALWFIPLEILFAFLGFLGTRDLAGFLGVCTAVGFTYSSLRPGRLWPGLREVWLRLQAAWMRLRLARMKKRRGFRVIDGENQGKKEPWVH